MTITRLRTPFPSLSSDNFVARGSAGHVFAISRDVIFKCATKFDHPAPSQEEEMKDSIEKMENEKAIYKILMEHRHPNIVHGILCVSEGIFMERLERTVQSRINQSDTLPVSLDTQCRWIQQSTNAIVWLEDLGYAHGDLRPANILLDASENIKLADFDSTVKQGQRLLVASEPFCKLNEDYELDLAGPTSEQFALGSLFYTIRFGHEPYHDLEASTRVWKLIKNEFPATSYDDVSGDIIRGCWCSEYSSIGELQEAIRNRLCGHPWKTERKWESVNQWRSLLLLAECLTFLAKESMRADNAMYWKGWKNVLIAIVAMTVAVSLAVSGMF